MEFLKNKYLIAIILGSLSFLVANSSQAVCGKSLSGVYCSAIDKVACRASDGTIKCVSSIGCNPTTQACYTSIVTTTPGNTPAYVNFDNNTGYLKIDGPITGNGNLAVFGSSSLVSVTANDVLSSDLRVYRTTGNNAELKIQSSAIEGSHWGMYQDRTSGELRFWNSQTGNNLVVSPNGNIYLGGEKDMLGQGSGTVVFLKDANFLSRNINFVSGKVNFNGPGYGAMYYATSTGGIVINGGGGNGYGKYGRDDAFGRNQSGIDISSAKNRFFGDVYVGQVGTNDNLYVPSGEIRGQWLHATNPEGESSFAGYVDMNQGLGVTGSTWFEGGNFTINSSTLFINRNSASPGYVLTAGADGSANWQALPAASVSTYVTSSLLDVLKKNSNASSYSGGVLIGTSTGTWLNVGGALTAGWLHASNPVGVSTFAGDVSVEGDVNIAVSSAYKLGGVNLAYGIPSLNNYFFGAAGNLTMTGVGNIASGYQALFFDTTGHDNIASGYRSLFYNNTGYANTATGYQSLFYNTTGNNNVANGAEALIANITGSGNIGLGNEALSSNVSGNNNIGIGIKADVLSNNLSNAIAIGYNAKVSGSNMMVLGGTGANAVKVGIGTSNPTVALDVVGQIKISGGTPGVGKVLTSDASGLASWAEPAGGSSAEIDPIWIADKVNYLTLVVASSTYLTRTVAAATYQVKGNYLTSTPNLSDTLTKNANASGFVGNVYIGDATHVANLYVDGGEIKGDWIHATNAVGTSTFAGNIDVSKNIRTSGIINAGGNYQYYGQDVILANNSNRNYYFGGAGNWRSQGINNTGSGYQALANNSTGYENVADGYRALYTNTTGRQNTAIGVQSLTSNTIGLLNTAVGYQTLYSNTYGNYNTAHGYQALYANTTGSNNTANGQQALRSNTTGIQNVAVGMLSLYSNISGASNIAIGVSSLYSNTVSGNNIAIGQNSLYSVTGYNNIGIGTHAGRYELASDSFYLDTYDRGTTAGDKAGALLYGKFSATPSSQTLRVNGNVGIGLAPTQKLDVNGAIRIRAMSKGVCDATKLGAMVYEEVSSIGHYYGCTRTSASTYAWKQLDN